MSNSSIARASVGRSIPSAPLRILDAPDLVDDYYLNLISWGHNNVSANAIYITHQYNLILKVGLRSTTSSCLWELAQHDLCTRYQLVWKVFRGHL